MKKRTYMNKPLGDTEYLLEQWGWWRMSGSGVPRYISPAYVIIRDNVQLASMSPNITDELAMTVDGCVARLCAREKGRIRGPLMGECLWLYFGEKWPAAKVGRYYKVSEGTARAAIRAGVAWVDCALENLRDVA